MKNRVASIIGALASLALLGTVASGQTVYVENFDTAPSSVGGAFSVSIGGDADGAGANNKEVVMGQWGLTGNGTFAGGNIQPQITTASNARLAGVFLDSTVMTAGAGTYTLEFDVVGGTTGGSGYVYVSEASGYDATNFVVLDLADSTFTPFDPVFTSDGTFTPGTGTAAADVLAGFEIIDPTVSQFNVKLNFVYDGTSAIAISFGGYATDVAYDNLSIYKSSTYATGFEGFALNTDFKKDFNVAYGSADLGTPPASTKFVDSAQWGITANGNDFADGTMRPQNSPTTLGEGVTADNVKMAGLFLDPVLFSGAGQYTITFDITGDPHPDANESYRAYVFEGSGYDFDDTGDNYLSLSLSSAGFGGYTGLTAVGTGVVATELVMEDISGLSIEPANNTVSLTFTYDGSSAIAFAVGGYNNASIIDNVSIAPFEAPSYTIYGTGFESFTGGTGALNEYQGGAGLYQYDGNPVPQKALKFLNPQWGVRGAAAFPGTVLQPQANPAANVKLSCIFLSPEYFKMGSGTYTVSFDLTGDPAGNAAYHAYVWKGSGTNGTTDYLSMDVAANGFGGLAGLTGTGAAAGTVGLLVDKDISFQSQLSGTVQVAIDFAYTSGDTICFAIGGYNNASTIDNLTVSTSMSPAGTGTVMYSTDFSSFTFNTEEAPLGEFRIDFNAIYGSEVPIDVVSASVNGSGEFILDFTGFASTSEIYEVFTSTDLASFSSLTTPLIATTDGSGVGQAVIPAVEVGPTQFFRIDDQRNAKLVGSTVWGITGNGNGFADGIARPQKNPATNIKMLGVFLDPSVFTAGAGTYTVSFELTGDTTGNNSYRLYSFQGSGYDLSGTSAGRLNLSLSAGGFGGYTGLTGLEGGVVNSSINVTSFDNAVDMNNAAAISATRMVSFDITWDGTSAVAIAIGGYNNAATIDNFFVVAP